jgi:hypothetical protein
VISFVHPVIATAVADDASGAANATASQTLLSMSITWTREIRLIMTLYQHTFADVDLSDTHTVTVDWVTARPPNRSV